MTAATRDVLITGEPGPVGLAVARRFLRDGHRVTVATPTEGTLSSEPLAQQPEVLVLLLPGSPGAGAPGPEGFEAISRALSAASLACRAALPAMKERRWGRIVGVGRAELLESLAGRPEAVAAWAGTLGFLRELAREVGPAGVTVNAVAMGLLQTDAPHPSHAGLVRRTALGRAGTPEEIAGMVAMVCSEGAGYLHGQCLGIDGGLS